MEWGPGSSQHFYFFRMEEESRDNKPLRVLIELENCIMALDVGVIQRFQVQLFVYRLE